MHIKRCKMDQSCDSQFFDPSAILSSIEYFLLNVKSLETYQGLPESGLKFSWFTHYLNFLIDVKESKRNRVCQKSTNLSENPKLSMFHARIWIFTQYFRFLAYPVQCTWYIDQSSSTCGPGTLEVCEGKPGSP